MTRRGDVVIVAFPYVDGTRSKNRPALIVQSDRNNQRIRNTIIAMISGNVRLASSVATQVLIDPGSAEGQSSGLSLQSVVKCENLFSLPQSDILRTLGKLSATVMQRVDKALKASLEL